MNKPSADEAFLQLMNEHQRIIFKICHSYCQHPDDREDLAQEIIYQLWKSYRQAVVHVKFSTWMYRVALNTAISFYRKDKKIPRAPNIEGHLIEIADDSRDEHNEQQLQMLQQFIQALPSLERALMLLYLDEKTHAEIADILGISESNVGTRIGRIKQQLRVKMAGMVK
ncbi:RNA polymerase sigma factor [Chitinophaga horti]|uniref:RNA polymerase sigma factor n=1 Tax=Chitinophaga horti TaxID=2920382 RepID=A0ABY6J4N7_9BACT|nr:RNA polymerase sigma factor [Chitinophaga horti]UYQ94587.1 RNA polymerase sigma factor [Chitinophaga horti]